MTQLPTREAAVEAAGGLAGKLGFPHTDLPTL